MVYSYYDFLRGYYDYLEDYYDDYYEYYYWPKYYEVYNISNDSWCDYVHQHNITYDTTAQPFNATDFNTTNITSSNTTNLLSTTNITDAYFNCTPRYNSTYPPSLYAWDPWWYSSIDIIGLAQVPFASAITTLCIMLAILFFVKLKEAMHTKNRNRPDKLTIFLSVSCMIAHCVYCGAEIFEYYYWFYAYSWDTYKYTAIVWEVFWILGKVFIYSLFAYRYYMLQDASINNQISKAQKVTLFGFIIIGIIGQIVCEVIYGVYYFDHLDTGWDDPHFAEKQRKYLNAAWIVMSMDFVLVSFLGAMIMRTILRLVVIMNDPSRNNMTSTVKSTTGTHSKQSRLQSIDSTAAVVHEQTEVELEKSATNKETQDEMRKQTEKPKVLRVKMKKSLSEWSRSGVQQKISEEREKRTSRQFDLMETTTRIALTCCVSLLSSFIIQCLWLFMEETENWKMIFVTWFWNVDALTNMCCVYFSMAFAKVHYRKVCGDICKCHQCCLFCVMKLVGYKVSAEKKKKETVESQSPDVDMVDITDVIPASPVCPSSPSTDAVL